MLVNMKEMLAAARKARKAVGAFNMACGENRMEDRGGAKAPSLFLL